MYYAAPGGRGLPAPHPEDPMLAREALQKPMPAQTVPGTGGSNPPRTVEARTAPRPDGEILLRIHGAGDMPWEALA